MTINLKMPQPEPDLKPRITVVGVGGAGGNAVNNMIVNNLEGVEFIACNTDAQALALSHAERKIQLGRNITQGLGAGSRPDVGRAAAEEAIEDIIEQIQSSNMVFITAGMGGGTGTGAAPVVARASREQGILTVGVITKPFQFEGLNRMRLAEEGIEELQHYVDTLIIIPNQNLFRIANEKTTFAQAFHLADNVLYSGVRGVTDLMVMPGLINLDFADVRQVMSEMGKAMMGTGEAEGENRAIAAAEAAISNPLLDDVSMEGAKGVLINISGGFDMTLFEVDEAANRIRSEVDPDANIIFGSTFDESLDGRIRISVISTGIDVDVSAQPKPRMISLVHDNSRGRDAAREAAAGGPGIAIPARMAAPSAAAPAQPPAQPLAQPPAAEDVLDLRVQAEPQTESGPEVTAPTAPTASPADPLAGTVANQAISGGMHPNADTPFLPPKPMAAPEQPPRPAVSPKPDPMAEAELINAGKAEAPQRKGPSLFERVTGTGRARLFGGDAAEPAPALAAKPTIEPSFSAPIERPVEKPAAAPAPTAQVEPPAMPAAPAAPAAPATPPVAEAEAAPPPAPQPAPVAKVPEAPPAPAPAPRQPALGGLEPDQAKNQDIEEDLLEIPAFLRRQAN
jgi:cell division protein FtsZ